MIHTFTGPSKLSVEQEEFVRSELADLLFADTRRSGCAYGVDTLVTEEWPPVALVLFVPIGHWHNRRMVAELVRQGAKLEPIPGGYRARNEFLVAGSDELHAFLRHNTFYRSGEWMTVNIAKRLGVPVVEHILP